jgi:hypothetical protein
MIFAHWKNITPITGVVGECRREVGRDEVAKHFIVDIPEGTARDDVVAKLVEKLLASGENIEKTDGLGFEEEWPQGIRRQFDSGSCRTLSWPSLE